MRPADLVSLRKNLSPLDGVQPKSQEGLARRPPPRCGAASMSKQATPVIVECTRCGHLSLACFLLPGSGRVDGKETPQTGGDTLLSLDLCVATLLSTNDQTVMPITAAGHAGKSPLGGAAPCFRKSLRR